VLAGVTARQPDSSQFRWWEIADAAYADTTLGPRHGTRWATTRAFPGPGRRSGVRPACRSQELADLSDRAPGRAEILDCLHLPGRVEATAKKVRDALG
jgi:hypothetical protein